MDSPQRRRRLVTIMFTIFVALFSIFLGQSDAAIPAQEPVVLKANVSNADNQLAIDSLNTLEIKGRAPTTGYSRSQFGDGWATKNGCDTRNIILNRDLTDVKSDESCHVVSGILNDPYAGKVINFERGGDTSGEVQIDHVVALSDAWQTGAQLLSKESRKQLANDPLELLAVDGAANQQKSGSDAASWLPSNKAFRCQYVARQIAVKIKYKLWVTSSEHETMKNILLRCTEQLLIE